MAIINLTPARGSIAAPNPAMQPLRDPVGAAAAEFGATLAELGRRTQEAEDASRAASAEVQYATELADLRVRSERGEFGADLRGGFEREAAALRTRMAEGLSGNARGIFGQRATRAAAEQTQRLIIEQGRRVAEMSEAQMMRELEEIGQRVASAPDDTTRRQLIEAGNEAINLRVGSNAISAVAGERMRQGFTSRLAEADARRLITANPGQAARALADERMFPGLSPERRASLLDTATRRADSEADRAVRLADLRDRRVERAAQQEASRRLNGFYARLDAAQRGEEGAAMPSREDLDGVRDLLSPGEYRAALSALRTRTERDAPAALLDLQPRVHSADPETFRRDAGRALERGDLTPGTYRSLVQQNEAARRDDEPASAYRSARAFVADALDPGNVAFSQFMRGPLALARQRALRDFDAYRLEHPNASREQLFAAGEALVSRYQQGAQTESRQSLPRPFSYTGGRDGIDEAAIRRAAQQLEAARAAGRITGAELAREVEILEAWRSLPQPGRPAQQQQQPTQRGRGPVQ